MKTILVTGGSGFIGTNFIKMCLEQHDCKIVNVDKLTYAVNSNSLLSIVNHPRYSFIHGDITDKEFVVKTIRWQNPDAIVHFAAETHVDRSILDPEVFLKTNTCGTFTLLEALRHHLNTLDGDRAKDFRFLHISTDEVYGALKESGYFTETSQYAPSSPYSASKAAADHFVKAYYTTFGIPTLITHCSNNYGPYQFPEKLIPLMTINALNCKPLPVYGNGKNVRDWIFVEDHCSALWTVLNKGIPGETYNIGGNCEKTNLEVVEAICTIIDELAPSIECKTRASLLTFVTDRLGHDWRYAIDSSKIRQELGWEPTFNFNEGLKRTVAWYLDNPNWIKTCNDSTLSKVK